MTDRGAVLLRPGKELRRDEPSLHKATYQALGIPIIGEIHAPGTVEGGDTLWLDGQTLAVGRGYRTNSEGIRQLTSILLPLGVHVLAYDLPHWNGAGMHALDVDDQPGSGKNCCLVYSRMMAVAFVERLEDAAGL